MNKGKDCCGILKNIRLQIAQENEIPFQIEPCTFDGDCRGTCPRCEAELLYLEQKIEEKKQLGKRALVAGISLGLISTFSACNKNNRTEVDQIYKKDDLFKTTFHIDTIERKIPTIIDFNHKPEEIKSEIKVKHRSRSKKTQFVETTVICGNFYTSDNAILYSNQPIDYDSILRGKKSNDSLK